jgi:DNA (cytosine-5)-methyltransferase 1
MKELRYFSMFSGIGGFELGIQNAHRSTFGGEQEDSQGDQRQGLFAKTGQDPYTTNRLSSERPTDQSNQRPLCVGYSEIDKYAIKVYERHYEHRNYGDATKINAAELPDFDLLVGGFPCQAFSIAGKRAGFNDTRGTLFFDIARILAEKRPRHLVLENVKGLLSHDGGKTFQTILGVLSDLGYRVEWQVLNSKDFGVPQNRERIYFVGHLGGECSGEVLPISGTDTKDINKFVDLTRRAEGNYRIRKDNRAGTLDANYYKGLANQERPGVINQLNQPTHSNDRVYGTDGVSPTLNTMQGGNRQPFVMGKIDRVNQVFELKDTETAGTLTSTMWKGINASGRTGVKELPKIRRLTPLECERLQGFPDDWTKEGINTDTPQKQGIAIDIISDTQRYKMCGNAVTTNTVQAVMENLIRHMEEI